MLIYGLLDIFSTVKNTQLIVIIFKTFSWLMLMIIIWWLLLQRGLISENLESNFYSPDFVFVFVFVFVFDFVAAFVLT